MLHLHPRDWAIGILETTPHLRLNLSLLFLQIGLWKNLHLIAKNCTPEVNEFYDNDFNEQMEEEQ
jgi:hypothetical protein